MSAARRFLAVVQDPRGYPPPGDDLGPAPPDGPYPPMVHSVVMAEEYDRLREALESIALHGDMPDGESWEQAYDEVTGYARAALETG